MAADEDHHFHPKDSLKNATYSGAATGAGGLCFAAIQNSLAKTNVGAWSVITRGGGTITYFAAIGGAYQFTMDAAANLREKDDSYNPAIGGLVAGAVMGLRSRSIPQVLGLSVMTSVLMGAFDYTGGALTGPKKNKERDEFEHKEYLRKNRRIPLDETIAQLGEGRGIYAPGYDERRQQRIKENYGIDVPAKSTHS
ncbi:NADH-ubiquinone oxidoreductase 213 kDa subunit [Glarea lozoyensis ATCC 20868]|uniref:NADH-ubiquinone oxidoreductase 213 kDa subunit n=1 Tax=Glarea lozoyensis (strain ATCC 20868 / MF5171) TaxID=1116229 RepID=S3CP81_GLAL2|nr:NADH-ubiquinone oxidoreductase 213 kDa subunit [Glarea lozoyensis ATCC 20868]EPE26969.1 NADH-ubiquinone oxidoreductase 213 kDa subunit [Glarea lozoyensis ATCC 20868]